MVTLQGHLTGAYFSIYITRLIFITNFNVVYFNELFCFSIGRCLVPYTRSNSTTSSSTSVTGTQSAQPFDLQPVGRAGNAIQYSLTKLDDLVNWARRVNGSKHSLPFVLNLLFRVRYGQWHLAWHVVLLRWCMQLPPGIVLVFHQLVVIDHCFRYDFDRFGVVFRASPVRWATVHINVSH